MPIAIVLAPWRRAIAGWQASAAYQQVDTALRQTAMAQEGILRDRLRRAAAMPGHEAVAVRIGGVQALAELAARNMDQYDVTVANLLEAFATSPVQGDEATGAAGTRWGGDIQVAKDAIEFLRGLRARGVERIDMEQMQDLLPHPPAARP